ncbi:MAG: replicative DNA helicase [Firmicutes bacterium]|nr:replicative DNA helicase [Bacillota bacterium]
MQERIPPHSEEAEKSVLGAAMLSKDALLDVLEIVKPIDFYNPMHREIYTAISEMHYKNQAIDYLTVTEELRKRNALEIAGGRAYIAGLSTAVPSTANAGDYAKIVAEKSILRKLIKNSDEVVEKCYSGETDADKVLDYAETGVFAISQSRERKEMTVLEDVLSENLRMIDEAAKHAGEVTGVPSGFKDLDDYLNGFQRSDLIILAARPAMGKTAFALNVAQQAALKGKASIAIFSLEMSKEQLGSRLLSMESRVESSKLRTGELNEMDWENLNQAMDKLVEAKIFIDDTPGISMMEIKNKCRRMKAEKGLDMVMIDYLQLMTASGKQESRQQEISTLSRQLKLLARELDCPVLVLSQLSRSPEQRNDHHPMLADLRESGSIEQDADIVLFLYRDDYYNQESSTKPGVCEVMIAKHRAGSTGTVELTWLEKYTRFADKAKQADMG